MAVHATHAATAPPTAPARESTGHLMLRAYCVFVLFTAFAASMWNNLLGSLGLGILIAALAVASVLLWTLTAKPADPVAAAARFAWRRLPWFVVLYSAWALASLIWTQWPAATLATWGVLAGTTIQSLFIASMLTWREIIRAIASALKWVMGLSLLFELWAALVTGPIWPFFTELPADPPKELLWTRALLFEGGRIQGIVGNANLLAVAALAAIVVFAVRIATVPRRGWLIAWTVLSAFLFVRAGSATSVLAAIAVVVVLVTALLMRSAKHPGQRTKWYAIYAAIAVGGGAVVWFFRDAIFGILGRGSDLSFRLEIWNAVLERVWQHPVLGWGFSTPWLPWVPEIDSWIIDHDLTVFMAHNMWIDALYQLGFIGLGILILLYLAFVWRAWFFAVDRPRWDLNAARPYSPHTLLPLLLGTILLVQGVAESRPLMEWGWLLVVLFAFKIKQSPHIGVGPAEQSLAFERGELTRQAT